MDTDPFWTLIAKCRHQGLSGDKRDGWLRDELRLLSPEGIVHFQACLEHVTDQAFTWNLWAAADRIFGGWCSDDTFCYFQRWMIGLGREVFEAAVFDADTLAYAPEVLRLSGLPRETWGEAWPEWDSLSYLAPEAYDAVTGATDDGDAFYRATTAFLDADRPYRLRPAAPSGSRWSVLDEPEAARRLPRLSAMFPMGAHH
ncbi:DUF4240 domain-containing protein [Streptomyces sp.]|uniref:DUF4240 domain-containing protein n=1 Tax=Streptomyces sp. TaxID=1931 RepID=UPI002F405399